jgi:hypothetical protein
MRQFKFPPITSSALTRLSHTTPVGVTGAYVAPCQQLGHESPRGCDRTANPWICSRAANNFFPFKFLSVTPTGLT